MRMTLIRIKRIMHSPFPTFLRLSRADLLAQLHRWHWISSALCLLAMLAFAISGITLNHAAQIEAQPVVTTRTATLPSPLLASVRTAAPQAPLSPAVRTWLQQALDARIAAVPVERSAQEVYLALPRPGGDAWLRIALADGAVEYERSERGWIAYLNDLHKGRHTGPAWSWLLDALAVLCLVFCVSGFLLLKMHARQRPSTWPLLLFGLVCPVLLALLCFQ